MTTKAKLKVSDNVQFHKLICTQKHNFPAAYLIADMYKTKCADTLIQTHLLSLLQKILVIGCCSNVLSVAYFGNASRSYT